MFYIYTCNTIPHHIVASPNLEPTVRHCDTVYTKLNFKWEIVSIYHETMITGQVYFLGNNLSLSLSLSLSLWRYGPSRANACRTTGIHSSLSCTRLLQHLIPIILSSSTSSIHFFLGLPTHLLPPGLPLCILFISELSSLLSTIFLLGNTLHGYLKQVKIYSGRNS